jgi:hypothetical protein
MTEHAQVAIYKEIISSEKLATLLRENRVVVLDYARVTARTLSRKTRELFDEHDLFWESEAQFGEDFGWCHYVASHELFERLGDDGLQRIILNALRQRA